MARAASCWSPSAALPGLAGRTTRPRSPLQSPGLFRPPRRFQTRARGAGSLINCQAKPDAVESPASPTGRMKRKGRMKKESVSHRGRKEEEEKLASHRRRKEDMKVGTDLAENSEGQASTVSQSVGFQGFPTKDINRWIAVGSTIAAVGLFLSTRLEFGVSLKDLSANAVPYEEALSNGMPTVVEFYADWCEVCRELAPDVYKVEEEYKDRVNFVMLNVDNTKWEQELDEFGVEGIPHFAFLDKDGNEEGNVVGRLPRKYLVENVAALANGESSVPHVRVVGQYSSAESRKVHQVVDPRSHG